MTWSIFTATNSYVKWNHSFYFTFYGWNVFLEGAQKGVFFPLRGEYVLQFWRAQYSLWNCRSFETRLRNGVGDAMFKGVQRVGAAEKSRKARDHLTSSILNILFQLSVVLFRKSCHEIDFPLVIHPSTHIYQNVFVDRMCVFYSLQLKTI